MTRILLLLLLLAPAARAEEDTPFELSVDPGTYSLGPFRQKGINAQAMERKKKSPGAIPDRATREAAFKKVKGLAKEITTLDELDRDRLYVLARSRKSDELRRAFPKIPPKLLSSLQKQLRKK